MSKSEDKYSGDRAASLSVKEKLQMFESNKPPVRPKPPKNVKRGKSMF